MKNKTDSNNFDLIRNILSFLVFFTHWNVLTASDNEFFIFHLSGIAIDLFFVVSGFLIWWSYNADRDISNFYLKRFFRVFPLYLILILLQTVFFIYYSNGSIAELFKYFITNIFFLNFLAPTVGDLLDSLEVVAINGSLWTLKNEVAFYILVPLIFKLYIKYGVKALYVIYICSVIYMLYFHYLNIENVFYFQSLNNEKMLVQFPAQIRLFLAGILLYIFFDKFGKYKPTITAAACLILIILFRDNVLFRFIIYPFSLGIFLIYVAYYIKPIIIKFDFSYSFYIVHFPLIQLAIWFNLNPSNPITSFILLFSLTVLISYVSEIYIEKRFIKLGRAIIKLKNL
jgi:peptidoglycan/LPS O-acetylase OafA/YrhL